MKEALARPDSQQWMLAMIEEITRLEARNSWEYVYPPTNANLISARFVYNLKGNNTPYCAQLVAQGYKQVEGLDYNFDNIFAPVARLKSVCAMCAIAAIKDNELVQIDIKSAFLHGRMEPGEDVYLVPSKGITLPGLKPGQVLKLCACFYGLKQAGRQWYQKLRDALSQIGFTRSQSDHAVFYRCLSPAEGSGTATIFCHVDDMGLKANKKYMPHFIRALKPHFELSEGRQIHYLLGMHITCDREKRNISFSQSAYINCILTRYRFDEVCTVTTPMDPNVSLSKEQCAITERQQEEMKNKPYREALGALMYASVGTRLDMPYTVSTLVKFSQNPGPTH
ncbi:hypothetical protein EW026_g8353 [Hermanssonia centrifuga]|uniref:Reverse transcriptase Ty1/copia-type domain-containing protein n=1 Tax=Hermanssonia centrifuga TaxID=98765 RepID=A0A4S4K4F2_9APHY|nr:hypothetical protein EW026_g8353 [Hermanssonia centrifuga]